MATFSKQVAASADDCRYSAAISSFSFTDIDLWFGNRNFSGDQDWQSGMRFTSVTIPQGATISAATLTFKARITETAGTVNLRIEGQAADDAATFSTLSDFTGRSRTAANASWSPGAWTANTLYTTADFTSVVQEIVNRAGWASGNNLALFIKNNGSTTGTDAYRIAYSFNNAAADAPQLDITYSVGGPTITVSENSVDPFQFGWKRGVKIW